MFVRRFSFTSAFAALVLLAPFVAGCQDPSTAPSATPPFSQADVRAGTGDAAEAGKTLNVHYTGWLFDPSKSEQKGLQFESSVGGAVFKFTLGSGQVIEGWDRGIPGMKVGGVRRLIIPPSLAYGDNRRGVIPPNTTLVFEIELVSIE